MHHNNQPTYGAPASGAYVDQSFQGGAQNPTHGAPHLAGGNQPAYGAPGTTYDNNAAYNTTGAGYGTHPQQVHFPHHGEKESVVDKVKDHLSGKHSHDPQNGGGYGAGYTGNEHGHSNVHPQVDTKAQHKANQDAHPSLMNKLKDTITGDKTHQNPQYGAPAGAPSHVTNSTIAHNQQGHYGATNPTYGAPAVGGVNDSYNNTQAYNSTNAHHGTTTGVVGAGHTGHHGSHATHDTTHGHHDTTNKPTIGEKIGGKIDVLMGKAQKNDAKVAQGEAKQGVVYGAPAGHGSTNY